MKRILLFTIVLFTFSLIVITSGVVLQATSGQVALAEVVETTKLAQLLEAYGIPVGIAGLISSLGTAGAAWLLTKGFKNSKKQMIKALEKVGLSSEVLEKLMSKLDYVETRLIELEEKSRKNLDNTYELQVVPLMEDLKTLKNELLNERKIQHSTVQKILALLDGEKALKTNKAVEV